jgi:hypothetical protein
MEDFTAFICSPVYMDYCVYFAMLNYSRSSAINKVIMLNLIYDQPFKPYWSRDASTV